MNNSVYTITANTKKAINGLLQEWYYINSNYDRARWFMEDVFFSNNDREFIKSNVFSTFLRRSIYTIDDNFFITMGDLRERARIPLNTTADDPNFYGIKTIGYFTPAETNDYYFRLLADNAFILWFDDILITDSWQYQWRDNPGNIGGPDGPLFVGPIRLEAGHHYRVLSYFIEADGGELYQLEWNTIGGTGSEYSQIPSNLFTRFKPIFGDAIYGTPVIGANIDEIWNNADEYTVGILKYGEDTGTNATFKTMWDSDRFYLLINVQDTTNFQGRNNFDGDSVEIYLSSTNSDSDDLVLNQEYVIGIGRNGTFYTDFAPIDESRVTYNVSSTYSGYTVQLSADIGTLTSGSQIGLEVQVNDCTEQGTAKKASYGWADSFDFAWKWASSFGTVNLADNNEK